MDRKIIGIFVAGGSGTRMGADVPKQFLELDGVPILQRTIARFIEAIPELRVITVLPSVHFDTWKYLCVTHDFNVPQTLVAGGITRFHSVRNALEKVPDDAYVLVHDGVRPLVSRNLVRTMAEALYECPAAIPVVPVVDTLRYKDGVFPDPDRSRIVAVQTPQAFHSTVLKNAYRQAYDLSFTDDASVVAANKTPLTQIAGERFNIKITTPEDLVLAEAIRSLCTL